MELNKKDAVQSFHDIQKVNQLEDLLTEFSDDELEFIATALKAAGKETLITLGGDHFDTVETDQNAFQIMEQMRAKITHIPEKSSIITQLWNNFKTAIGLREDPATLVKEISFINDPLKMMKRNLENRKDWYLGYPKIVKNHLKSR